MNIINQLPKSVANQIAAGEVIQRPSSIIKELVENSIDAKAKNIKIIIKDAGKQSISVIDDGVGMSRKDSINCFNRHATSKLSKSEDLYKIKTMGFRGEALASIVAVSEVVLKTRSSNNKTGYQVILKDSIITEKKDINFQKGTSITCKNLFYSVPARRNFLKSNNVELRHIIEEFIRCAIANYNLNFILINEEAEVYNLKATNLKKRLVSIFKKNYENNLISCKEKYGGITIEGYIGKPENTKKTRGEQYIYVNNRFIKNGYLNHAIINSYEGLIEDKKFPFYVLFITINTDLVDINIHPTKTEIKFEDEKLIYSLVKSSVKKSLEKFNISPSINFDADVNFTKNINFLESEITSSQNKRLVHSEKRKDWDKIFENVKIENSDRLLFENKDSIENENKPVQFLENFIFKQLGEKLLIFNHKNCQQRILFEKYQKNSLNNYSNTQQSLFPQFVEFNSSDFKIIEEILEDIRSIGFSIDIFGKNSVVINGIPSGLDDINEKEIVEGFVEEVKNNNLDLKSQKKELILKSFSKKARITNSKNLSQTEMNLIIDRLFACENPKYSPDGKPNYIELGIDKVENLF
ncbi:MAG: DNA mismatch repair endonuclease MutL [Bacteroidota bacterium]|nr:DNA mismatch repair endonuclease MutL [Bacteroidota bacterium]